MFRNNVCWNLIYHIIVLIFILNYVNFYVPYISLYCLLRVLYYLLFDSSWRIRHKQSLSTITTFIPWHCTCLCNSDSKFYGNKFLNEFDFKLKLLFCYFILSIIFGKFLLFDLQKLSSSTINFFFEKKST